MRLFTKSLIALAITVFLVGCQNQKGQTYVAHLNALNTDVSGSNTTGEAKFVVKNDSMTVTIDVKNAPANMEHWQHFHGFKNGDKADCATTSDDKNGDDIVDVVETEAVSGTTMVPFNKFPAKMEIGTDTYPRADENGDYHYEAKFAMKDLKKSFKKAFNDSLIQLDHRVLYIHGISTDQDLPETVASIANIPAQVTIPIACGKIEKK